MESNLSFGSIEDLETDVKDYTINGKCRRCGGCCSNFLPISFFDKKRIKAYIKQYDIKEQRTLLPTTEQYFDITCPFLSRETNYCQIYSVRPLICQRFICNQPPEVIQKQKEALINLHGITNLRKEFFDSSLADIKLW